MVALAVGAVIFWKRGTLKKLNTEEQSENREEIKMKEIEAVNEIEDTQHQHPTNADIGNFQLVNVEQHSLDFERLLETFNLSMQRNHKDYVISRIQNKLKPVSFHL